MQWFKSGLDIGHLNALRHQRLTNESAPAMIVIRPSQNCHPIIRNIVSRSWCVIGCPVRDSHTTTAFDTQTRRRLN